MTSKNKTQGWASKVKSKKLKDIGDEASEKEGLIQCCRDCQIDHFWSKLRAEVIKWLKEDYKDWRSDKGLFQSEILGRWMKRFNITESDLK